MRSGSTAASARIALVGFTGWGGRFASLTRLTGLSRICGVTLCRTCRPPFTCVARWLVLSSPALAGGATLGSLRAALTALVDLPRYTRTSALRGLRFPGLTLTGLGTSPPDHRGGPALGNARTARHCRVTAEPDGSGAARRLGSATTTAAPGGRHLADAADTFAPMAGSVIRLSRIVAQAAARFAGSDPMALVEPRAGHFDAHALAGRVALITLGAAVAIRTSDAPGNRSVQALTGEGNTAVFGAFVRIVAVLGLPARALAVQTELSHLAQVVRILAAFPVHRRGVVTALVVAAQIGGTEDTVRALDAVALASPTETLVVGGTIVPVVAGFFIGQGIEDAAAGGLVATITGAGLPVVADQWGPLAVALIAGVIQGAGVCITAGPGGERVVLTALDGIAGVFGALVVVVAVRNLPILALTARVADLSAVAGVGIVADLTGFPFDAAGGGGVTQAAGFAVHTSLATDQVADGVPGADPPVARVADRPLRVFTMSAVPGDDLTAVEGAVVAVVAIFAQNAATTTRVGAVTVNTGVCCLVFEATQAEGVVTATDAVVAFGRLAQGGRASESVGLEIAAGLTEF